MPAEQPETPLSPGLKSPSLKVPVTPAEAARIRAVVLPKDEISARRRRPLEVLRCEASATSLSNCQ